MLKSIERRKELLEEVLKKTEDAMGKMYEIVSFVKNELQLIAKQVEETGAATNE